MLNIITSKTAFPLRYKIISDMVKKSWENKRQILIVPESSSHEAERMLSREGGNKIGLDTEIITFERLSLRVFGETYGLADKALDNGGKVLAMKSAIDLARPALKMYHTASQKTSFISDMVKLVSELKESMITPDRLGRLALKIDGQLKDKLTDISYIYSAYQKKTEEGEYDPDDINKMTAERIQDADFLKGILIYIDGFSGFTPQQYMVIGELIKYASNVTISMLHSAKDVKDCENYDEAYYKEANTIKKLLKTAQRCGSSVQLSEAPEVMGDIKSLSLNFIAENMFNYSCIPYNGNCEDIHLCRARDMFSECEYAAASIKKLVREKGIRYRDITITARNLESYTENLRAVFEYYGIPLFISEKDDILKKPVFAFLTSSLKAAADFDTGSIIKSIKTGFSDISCEEADRIEAYASLWRLNSRFWRKDRPFTLHPNGISGRNDESSERLLRELNDIKMRIVNPLEALRENLKLCKRGGDYIRALYTFITELSISQKIEKRAKELYLSGDKRVSAEYLQLWEILITAMEQFFAILENDIMTLQEFSELFWLLLSAYSVDTIPVSIDSVKAVSMDRMGYMREKYLFVIGASDADIPAQSFVQGILNSDDRQRLIEENVEIEKTSAEMAQLENGIVFKALTAAERLLVCTYPSVSNDGRELRPSFAIKRLLSMFSGLKIEDAEKDDSVQKESPGRFYDLLCRYTAEEQDVKLRHIIAMSADENVQRLNVLTQNFRNSLNERDEISSADVADKLYGNKLILSSSKIETFSSCRCKFFMQYGLSAEAVKRAELGAPEIGNFIHYILEHSIGDFSREGGLAEADSKRISDKVKTYTKEYADAVLGGFGDKTERFKYLFSRLSSGAEAVISNVVDEFRCSLFAPIDFECTFAQGSGLRPYPVRMGNGRHAYVVGNVDRVDGYINNGKLYVRVEDYKTGLKAFRLSDIRYGLNMQMLIYLFAIQKGGYEYYKNKLGVDIERIVPAGVLYTRAVKPVIELEAGTDGQERYEYEKLLAKELRRSGIIADDRKLIDAMEQGIDKDGKFIPVSFTKDGEASARSSLCSYEDFAKISEYIDRTVSNIADGIRSGKISPNPYVRSASETMCSFCQYRAACLFDLTRPKNRFRYLKKMSDDEFLEELRSKEKGEDEDTEREKQKSEEQVGNNEKA